MVDLGFAIRAGFGAAGILAAAAAPTPTHAQTALPTIVVTDEASESDESGQDVPASTTVLPRQTLDDAGIDTVQDIARHTPNFLLSDQGSPRFSINTIRGIGNTVRDDYFNTSLGVYLDGVPLTNAEFNRRLGDIERVEILRGPQGTLYGPNTPAGVINLTSRAPTDELEAEAVGTIGNNGQREGSAWISGPLADTGLTGRLFFDYATRDGFTDYLQSGNSIDDLESITGSGALRFQPDDRLAISVSGSIEHVDQGAYAYLPYDSFQVRAVDITPPNREVRDSRGLAATVTYDFDDVRLTSISGLRDYDVHSDQDLAYNPFVRAFGGGRSEAEESGRQFSQEIRLSGGNDTGFSWLAGAFLQADTVDYDYLFSVPAFGPPSLSASTYDRQEFAGFGEATWNIVGGLDLTAGLRVTHEHHEIENNFPFQDEANFTLPTPKLRIAYRFDDDRLVYASATRGARAGGFNRLAANDRYDSEYLWSYEAGFKSEWFDRTLTLNGAAFYIDWTDQQVKTLVSPGVVRTTNAGRSHSQGFELETSWRPVEGLELSGFVGVTDGEYDEFIGQAGTSLAGNTLVNTPEVNAGLAAQYRHPFAGGALTAVARAEFQYVGDHYFDPENELEQEGYGLVNLRAGIENENFSATLFVRNLFDKDYRAFGYHDFQGSPFESDVAVAGASRLFGVTVSARF